MMRELGTDLRVLSALGRGRPKGGAAASLDAFYAPQADDYDRFRERLLHGRADLIERLSPRGGEYWAELGGGTARNLEFLGARRERLDRIDVVDLCTPLLAQARIRCRHWPNVHIEHADARHYRPARALDGLWFSYALSMMERFDEVILNARRILRPGGRIGVVDFFVSSAHPGPGRVRHGPLSRRAWTRWFAHDGVRVSPEIPDALMASFPHGRLTEHLGSIPWLPVLKVPYFIFDAVSSA